MLLSLDHELQLARELLLERGFHRAAMRLQLKGKRKPKPRFSVVYVGAKPTLSAAFRIESDRIAAPEEKHE